jgi:hypothetical protein
MRPYLITAKLMRPSNMKRFPTPDLNCMVLVRNNAFLLVIAVVAISLFSQVDSHGYTNNGFSFDLIYA